MSVSDRAGRAQPLAPSFAWTLPSVPDASGCPPSVEIFGHDWAESGEQLPVQPERHHNRGNLDKDAPPVRGVLHPNPVSERKAESIACFAMANRAGVWSISSNKAGHEPRRAGNTPPETMGRARQPGSADRQPARNPRARLVFPKNIIGARIKIESDEIRSRLALNGQFLSR